MRELLFPKGEDAASEEIELELMLEGGVMEDVVVEIGVNEYPPVLLILVDTSVVLAW